MSKTVHPMVLHGEGNRDAKRPMVLSHLQKGSPDYVDPDQPVVEAEQPPVEYLRSNQAISGRVLILHDDGTVTDRDGNPIEGIIVHRHDDGAPVVVDSAPESTAAPEDSAQGAPEGGSGVMVAPKPPTEAPDLGPARSSSAAPK